MSVLFICTQDIDGGAARAAYRLYRGIQATGESARMFVLKKSSGDATVFTPSGWFGTWMPRLNYRLDGLALRRYPNRQPGVTWSINWIRYPVESFIAAESADLLHLHWIGSGFIPIEALARVRMPMIWTLHDEWAYTGGCHYTDGCSRFTGACGRCPLLGSLREQDITRRTWARKAKQWRELNLTLVAPSHWIAQQARASSLFADRHIEVIPNGIDTRIFKPIERSLARTILNLPLDKKLILFGGLSASGDRRKGLHLLQSALQRLSPERHERAELLVVGASKPVDHPDFGLPCHFLGRVYDDVSLALIYAAADVFVAPSLQDNLPNTVMEAASCGTPSVSFRIGGLADLIDHQETGYLAQPFDVDDLAHGIDWILSKDRALGDAARHKVETNFDIGLIANRYRMLYRTMNNEDTS